MKLDTIKDLIKNIVKKPDNVENYLKLAKLYIEQGKYDLAINSYESILNLEPNNIVALSNLGSIYFFQENVEKSAFIFLQKNRKATFHRSF